MISRSMAVLDAGDVQPITLQHATSSTQRYIPEQAPTATAAPSAPQPATPGGWAWDPNQRIFVPGAPGAGPGPNASFILTGDGRYTYNGNSGDPTEATTDTTLQAAENDWLAKFGALFAPTPAPASSATPPPTQPPPIDPTQYGGTTTTTTTGSGAAGNTATPTPATSTAPAQGTDPLTAALISALQGGGGTGVISPDMAAGVPSTAGLQSIVPTAAPTTTTANPAVAIVALVAVVGGAILAWRKLHHKKGASTAPAAA